MQLKYLKISKNSVFCIFLFVCYSCRCLLARSISAASISVQRSKSSTSFLISESCMPAPSSTTDILTLFSSLRVFIVIQLSGMLNFSAFISRFDSTVWHFCLSSHISSISVSICNFMDIPFSLASSVKSLTISAIHPSNLHLCTFNLL